MNFEAGNETREKIWSDFLDEQNQEWSEKRVVFYSHRCFLESEKLRCEKRILCAREIFCSRAAFYSSFLLRGLVMILFQF